ncbi:MAG: YjfB family protein [Thermoguttaceae bacterium]
MFMELAHAATQIKQAQLGFEIGMAVAKKGLDAQKAQGEAAVQLLEAAAQLSKSVDLGQNFDAVG